MMATFLELLLLQILIGYAYTFPGGNLGQQAHQPSSHPPSPYEQRICRDDRVEGLIKLVESQHEEQMGLLRTLARCQCSGQDNHVEYHEYIPQEEEAYEEVPEFPVPAPYEVPAPPSVPTLPVATYLEPSEVPTAKKYQTQSTTLVYSTTAPPPTKSRYQGPSTSMSPPPVPTTISPPVPTAKKYQTQTTTQAFTTTAPPPTRSRYQSPPTTTIAPPAPTARKYQTQPTTTTTAVPPPTRSSYQSPPTATIAPPVPTAERYQAPSPDDLIPEEYDESRSFSVFPECDGDCPTIPDANPIPRQSSYEEVSTSYETESSTTEYNEPPPVPEQGSGLGNYRTNPRRGVSPVPLPDEDLEEIVKELEKSYPPNYLPGYEQSYGGII